MQQSHILFVLLFPLLWVLLGHLLGITTVQFVSFAFGLIRSAQVIATLRVDCWLQARLLTLDSYLNLWTIDHLSTVLLLCILLSKFLLLCLLYLSAAFVLLLIFHIHLIKLSVLFVFLPFLFALIIIWMLLDLLKFNVFILLLIIIVTNVQFIFTIFVVKVLRVHLLYIQKRLLLLNLLLLISRLREIIVETCFRFFAHYPIAILLSLLRILRLLHMEPHIGRTFQGFGIVEVHRFICHSVIQLVYIIECKDVSRYVLLKWMFPSDVRILILLWLPALLILNNHYLAIVFYLVIIPFHTQSAAVLRRPR